MKDYVHFCVNDFVMDANFQDWVKNPGPESDAFWRAWMADHPQKLAEIEEARYILKNLNFPEHRLTGDEVAELWTRIRTVPVRQAARSTQKFLRWGVAAAIALFAVALYALNDAPEKVTYETAFGQTRSITLPDGSSVTLNANSKLSYTDNWDNANAREVQLYGEAFFSVTHQENDQPFVVRTGDGVAVEVLGTTFDVYHRTQETKVLLNTGKIRLSLPSANNEKIIMQPGELVEFRSNQVSRKNVNPQNYVAWTENRLVLDHTSLREMVRMLHDNYGIYVEVSDPQWLDQTVSGSMPTAGEEELVLQIAKAFQLQAEHKGDTVILTE
ncbi:MAG TPA: FecR domain-containing protein [Cyclobacteriaceae bacterium]|nr:FecR domain-containing protein [Cyclobacteriaceae bacterium]